MAIRTNRAKVEGVLERDTSIPIDPFITTANLMVDWLDSKDTDSELSDALLLEIETYLAAHFYTLKDQRMSFQMTGAASASYQGKFGMGLHLTDYGQMAMVLDVTNNLALRSKEMEEGKKQRIGATWIGTPDDSDRPENITDFDDNILPSI